MQSPLTPHFLALAEADARRRLGVPSDDALTLLARRQREPDSAPLPVRSLLAGALAAVARRLAAVAEDLDPNTARRLGHAAQR